ncbi:hypothetical protein ANN_01716 [Periplaneta americana]|uniref:Uncharacterized protein n=1 Tax=Periplaneta americana TaxID=6978 RepID=A0ABQ8TUA9_PERAM|nr:hypothetical protein ANN_01716 [Periplaneta americana]
MGESRNAYRVLVGRPEGKRHLGRPRRRWEDNIKMDLREVGYDDRDWINLAQDRDQWRAYVRAAMNLRVPQKPVFDLTWNDSRLRATPNRRTNTEFNDSKWKFGDSLSLGNPGLATFLTQYSLLTGHPSPGPSPGRPGWQVGIALAFYAQGCGFDPGPGRWHLSVLKCDRLMSVDLLACKRTPAGQNSGTSGDADITTAVASVVK